MSYSISASPSSGPPSNRRSLAGAAWSRVTSFSGANYGSILSLLVFLAIWEAAVRSGLLPAVLVPPPSSVVPSFLREQSNGMWLHNVLASLRHYAMGVAAGSILGIALGVASGLWPAVQKSQEGV